MAANNETKVQKSNTLEQWRVATNTVSHHVGDIDLLDSRLTDKVFTFTGDGATTRFGFGTDTGSKTLRIELQPENPIDAIAQVILTGSPSLTGFVADVVVFQGSVGSETFTAQINYINANRIVLRNITGTFDASADLKYASNTIGNANIVRLISESYNTGYAKVQVDGNTQVQSVENASQAGYHILNYSLEVALTGSPSIPATFTEGAVVTQSGGFSGTLLEASTTHLRFKSHTGTFSTSQNAGIPHSDASNRLLAANLSSATAKDTAIGTVVEFHTAPGSGDVITIDAQNLVDSITEVQDDVGTITNLGTNNKSDIVNAINEIEDAARGANANYNLGTNAQNFRDAINELESASRGTNVNYTLGTDAANFRDGINELETAVRGTTGNYTIGTDSNDLVGAVNEIETALRGGGSNYTLGTTATNIVAGINEIETALRGSGSNYTLNTAANDVVAAINEHESDIGTVGNLTTSATNLTLAINELDLKQGAAALGTSATTLSGAINELHGEINTLDTNHLNKNLAANVNQNITGSITFTGDSVDFSNTTALFSAAGGVANFGSAFVNLNATSASGSNVALQGLQVDRTAISGGAATHDVRLIWNEGLVASKPDRAWQLRGMTTSGADNTADIVTFYNAQDLIANNTESGIAVTWDTTNQNFDFNVNDPTLTFTGDVTGSGTLTNLGNLSVALTVQPNSVALGTDTTGNYISTIAGTSNQITVSGSGSETSAVTLSLPSNVAISGEMEAGSLDINGNADISGNLVTHGNLNVNGNTTLGNASSDTVSIPGNMTITGDLTVNGTNTILNTSTLEVEDTLILTGTSSTEPTTGGFGIETRSFTGVGTHSGNASNVTGSHSFVYNFGTDRWEADGNMILDTVNSIIIPQVKINSGTPIDLTSARDLNLIESTGIDIAGGLSGTNINFTFTNTDRGSSQNIYKNIAANSGGTAVANSNNDTLTISGGSSLTSARSGDTITINHNVTGASSVNNSNGTVIQDLTINTNGHVTAVGSVNLDNRYSTNPVNLTGNQTIAGTKTFSSTISGSINGNAATISNQANSATITASTAGSANLIALRDGSGNLTAARFLGPITPSGASGVLITHSDIRSAASSNWTGDPGGAGKIQYHSNRWYIVADQSSNRIVQFRRNNSDVAYIDNSGNFVGNVTGNVSGTAGSISSQSNSATITATSSNTGNQIVLRNASGNFSAGTITAYLSGNISGNAAGSSSSCTGNSASATTVFVNDYNGGTTMRILGSHNGIGGNGNVYSTSQVYINMSSNIIYASGFSGTHYGTWSGTAIAYSSLSGTPSIPTHTSQLTNNSGFVTSSGVTSVATSNGLSGGTITSTGTISLDSDLRGHVNYIGQSTSNYIRWNDDGDDPDLDFYQDGSQIGRWTHNGKLYAKNDIIAFQSSFSDERLKENIQVVDSALEKVSQLNGVTFNWKKNGKQGAGVIAQNLEKVLPSAVTEVENMEKTDTYKAVYYDQMSALFIEAIKELTEQNKELKAEIENLKSINS